MRQMRRGGDARENKSMRNKGESTERVREGSRVLVIVLAVVLKSSSSW
jgi:hypothetical protein